MKPLPMLATKAAPFDAEDYLFEVKWDGVRALAAVEHHTWSLWGRHGDIPRCVEGDRASRRGAGTQPGARLGQAPVATQHFEQAWGQDREPFLGALAGADVKDHASRID